MSERSVVTDNKLTLTNFEETQLAKIGLFTVEYTQIVRIILQSTIETLTKNSI